MHSQEKGERFILNATLLKWIQNNTGRWLSTPRPRAKDFMILALDLTNELIRIKFRDSIYLALPLYFWMFDRTLEHLSKDPNESKPLGAKLSPPYMKGSVEEAIWRKPFPKINTEYKSSPHVCDILHYAGFIEYRPSRNPETNRKVQGAKLNTSIKQIIKNHLTQPTTPRETHHEDTPILNSQTVSIENLSKQELLLWANKYDEDHPWWAKKEKEIGDKIRADNELGLDTLKEIVEWKFKTVPSRIKRIYNLLKQYNDEDIREVTRWVLPLGIRHDNNKITALKKIKGIGVSLASTILTFYNPHDYCVYDIHVMREMYGELPKYPFTQNKHYLRLLKDLREISIKLNINVRTIEKALFKKNLYAHAAD